MSGAVLVVAATGGLQLDAWIIGVVFLLAGFAGLAVTRVASAQLRPTSIALVFAIIVAGFMLLGLPWPPGRSQIDSFVTLSLGISFSLGALLLGARSPRITVAMLGLLSAYGILILARFGHSVASGSDATAWSHPGPAMTLSLVLAESIGAAWIAAF